MVSIKDMTKIWNGGEKEGCWFVFNKISIGFISTIDFQPSKPNLLFLTSIFSILNIIYRRFYHQFASFQHTFLLVSPKTFTNQTTLFLSILFKHGEGRKKHAKLGRSGTINFRIVSKVFKLSQVGDHYWRRINPLWQLSEESFVYSSCFDLIRLLFLVV